MPTVSLNTHFPGYEIIGELGRSNARVLKARHLETGDLVAIKHFALNTDAETLRRFRLESQLMTDIRHPNVVRVRDVQLDMPMPFIVMEWIEGGNLRTLLTEQGHLTIQTTIRLAQQMAEAFKAIHPRGIVHRDIKPENILFRLLSSGELHFLLTDFGVARIREQSQTMTGQSLMTYEYASPEQFDNPKGVDVATDYYSLGIVLYECLSGNVPFSLADSAGIAAFMNQVLQTRPSPILLPAGEYLPSSLDTILSWTLAKDPAERLSDVNELVLLLGQANVEQLQASRSGDRRAPVMPRTVAAPVPITPPVEAYSSLPDEEPEERSNGWMIGLGVLIVGILIGLAIFYTNQRKPNQSLSTPDSTITVTDSSDLNTMTDDTAAAADYPPEETPIDSSELYTAPAQPVEPSTTNTTPTIPDSTTTPTDSAKTNP
ncbi:serine/threonine protein kinase [Spirosoma agri]|uniref:non-specific serine/threonine protein kinase n=1 Tax=Spirosoma agri TaxID=1987381 RepID=A0A6M0ISS6_9BACT|nr:serine/threonine-protein kinase [Spirosoma agri]NEU70143.1 serine/threonine protein kinase [Spirosoma agri]